MIARVRGLSWRERISFALLAGLLGINCIITLHGIGELDDDAAWVAHTLSVRQAALNVELSVMRAQSSVRGYSLGREEDMLRGYTEARQQLPQQIGRLHAITPDNPAQQMRIARLQDSVDALLGFLAERIQVARATPRSRGVPYPVEQGVQRADEVSGLIGAIIDQEGRLLAERKARMDRNRQRTIVIAFSGPALGLFLLALFALARLRSNRAQARAFEQEQWFRTALASIGDAVLATDQRGAVIYTNEVAARLTGWNLQDARGRRLEEVFHIVNEHSRAPVENPAKRALREGSIVGLANHTVLIARDGTEYQIDDSAAPIRDANGDLVGAVLVFRDVREARAAQRALAESEARKRAMFQSAIDAIITIDAHGHILEFNTAAERIFGYAHADVAGREMADLIVPPSLREQHRKGLQRHLSTGKSTVLDRQLEMTGMRADGTEFPAELSITRIDVENAPLFTAYLRDITERKRSQGMKAQLAAIVDSSSDAIVSKDLHSIISTWNKGAEQLFGYSAEEAIGRSITMLIPDDRLDEEPGILERIRHGEQVDHFETVRRRKDGSLVEISLTISPIFDVGGQVIGASKIARDISQQMRARRDLARAAEDLRRADVRKDEFLATLAHELRGPLAPLSNALQLMELAGGDHDTSDRARTMMVRQVDHMVRLIDDLMDLSRISRGVIELHKDSVDLRTIVQQAVEAARPLIIQQGHELHLELDPEPLWMQGDPARLVQVFSNLLLNAARYTDPGGRITVHSGAAGDQVTVSVADTGVGISAEHMDRVFDMFAQLEPAGMRARGGLGIGLHIVQRIVHMHGGQVQVSSPGKNKGSTFTVTLPLVAPWQDTTAAQPPRPHLEPVPVLITDDNVEAALTLAMLVRAMGHPAEVTHNAADAVERVTTFKPALVFMDIGMPEVDGYEACRRIRSLPGADHIHMVALTGWGQEGDRYRALSAGFDEHLVKPITREGLLAALEAAQVEQQAKEGKEQ